MIPHLNKQWFHLDQLENKNAALGPGLVYPGLYKINVNSSDNTSVNNTSVNSGMLLKALEFQPRPGHVRCTNAHIALEVHETEKRTVCKKNENDSK